MPKFRTLPVAEWADSPKACRPILEYLMDRGGPVAIDTETTGLNVIKDRILFWSLATEERRICLPVEALYSFDPLFRRKDIIWYLANAKYDMHLLANHGVELAGDKWDIVVMDALEDDTRQHGLKEQAKRDFGVNWGEFKDLFISAAYLKDRLNLSQQAFSKFRQMSTGDKLLFVFDEDPDIVIDYATCDAYFTYLLAELRARNLSLEELPTDMVPGMDTLLDYFKVLEVPLTQVLWDMERYGVRIDLDVVKSLDGPMRDTLRATEFTMDKVVGDLGLFLINEDGSMGPEGRRTTFNPKSTAHVADVLFNDDNGFKLKPVKYTDGGSTGRAAASTDEDSLEALLRRRIPDEARQFIDALLKHKSTTKLHGTYIRDLKKKHLVNGRIHCRFNQAGARTGRLSSANPNLQNIPARTELGKKIREAFVPSPGCSLLVADYPQIEFRIVAVLAGEEGMMEDIRKGWDVHNANTARIYADKGATYEDVAAAKDKKKDELTDWDKQLLVWRNNAKTAGLGTLYGEGKYKMAADLKIDPSEAGEIQDLFRAKYAAIAAFEQNIKDYSYENGYTFTMLGRKRRLHRIQDQNNPGLAAAEERQALNTAVQGSGAELLKLAMLRCYHDPELRSLGFQLLINVHDEIVAEAPTENAERAQQRMVELMADPYRWGVIDITYPVPIDPDGSVGANWAEAK